MKIERINKGEWGKIRAFFDLRTQEGIVIKGFKLVEGINGMFVGMPSQKGKDEEYFDTVFMDRDLRDELNQISIDAYEDQNFNSGSQQSSSNQEKTKQAEPAETTMPDELSPADSTETVQPFDDNDIPF